MLTRKAVAACVEHGVDTLVIVGGVAANARVRSLAEERCRAAGVELRMPPPWLCTDNGAMIAAVGDPLVRAGAAPAPLDVSVDPSAPLEYATLHPAGAAGPADRARLTAHRGPAGREAPLPSRRRAGRAKVTARSTPRSTAGPARSPSGGRDSGS